MTFAEKPTEHGYTYEVTEGGVFESLEIHSPHRLVSEDGDTGYLDDVYYAIEDTARKNNSMQVEGDIKGTEITYKLVKINPWEYDRTSTNNL